ncbi:MAG: AmmeMemoRadiSam system protein B [Candidatus Dadabacteria bacterium]|nr:MAG: AmmeMemoRadiSam system protein B [Candidatus Dadabacteria bacterium]
MSGLLNYPKLRWPLDINLRVVDGQKALVMSCPLGISPNPLALNPVVSPLLSLMDGKHSVDQITERFRTQGLDRATVVELVEILDNALFLDTDRYKEAEKISKTEFARAEVRPAALAGLSYPASKQDLEFEIDRYLACSKREIKGSKNEELIGLVSPHIDYRRGGVCYGITYSHLKGHRHDLYILIGTSHQYSELMFHMTMKDFATPLGILKCDKSFVTDLAKLYGYRRSFADELLHKKEHSLELQTPFLARTVKNPVIVPILVGSFYPIIQSGKQPDEYAEYSDFVAALSECMRLRISQGQKICIIAGVDMAHVGRSFGDSGALSEKFMRDIEGRDKIYLDSIVSQDKARLFSHIVEDNDRRRVCGFPTMYTVIDLYDKLGINYSSSIYDYRQAVDYQSDCAVTFAGMGLYLNEAEH